MFHKPNFQERSAALKLGSTGPEVEAWQNFLRGLNDHCDIVVTGVFDEVTARETRNFQRMWGLDPDGQVGKATLASALQAGLVSPTVQNTTFPSPSWTPMTHGEKIACFEEFKFTPNPSSSNPEGITILGDWVARNIVTVHIPQLKGILGAPSHCKVPFHRKGADQLVALWAAWEEAGLLPLVLSFAGTWVPRFVRGSRTTLSNHAYGTAFDVNATWNPLGAKPAAKGKKGSVGELLPLAYEHGFQWGGAFGGGRIDGMHFQIGKLLLDFTVGTCVSLSIESPTPPTVKSTTAKRLTFLAVAISMNGMQNMGARSYSIVL